MQQNLPAPARIEPSNIVEEKLSNGNTIRYQIVNGTAYNAETAPEVVKVLEAAMQNRKRYKFYLGDTKTGRDWCEEWGKTGRLGRSTGSIKIPLLILTSRSIGGGHLMDDNIVKIVDAETKRVVYQHPLYIAPVIEIVAGDMPQYPFNTIVNGTLHGRHSSLKSAQICKSKIS